MTTKHPKFEPKPGDLVAWESQAMGSWKTKVGTLQGYDGKFALVGALISYHVSSHKDVGIPHNFTRHRAPRPMRPSVGSLREPTELERKAVKG